MEASASSPYPVAVLAVLAVPARLSPLAPPDPPRPVASRGLPVAPLAGALPQFVKLFLRTPDASSSSASPFFPSIRQLP